jgi:hypothetical protein
MVRDFLPQAAFPCLPVKTRSWCVNDTHLQERTHGLWFLFRAVSHHFVHRGSQWPRVQLLPMGQVILCLPVRHQRSLPIISYHRLDKYKLFPKKMICFLLSSTTSCLTDRQNQPTNLTHTNCRSTKKTLNHGLPLKEKKKKKKLISANPSVPTNDPAARRGACAGWRRSLRRVD